MRAAVLVMVLLCTAQTVRAQVDERDPPPRVDVSPPADARENALPDRPGSAGRIVRHFDFEPSDDNALPIPPDWVRGQNDPKVRDRPGFPLWNEAVLDASGRSPAGIGAVRLPTRGGSTSLLLLPGSIAVFPGADYLVTTLVRTEGLAHAAGVLAARFLDESGKPIPGAEFTSGRLRTQGEWQRVSVELLGEYPDARFLQLELMLLQPAVAPEPDGPRWSEDYTGSVWFDELVVMQMPRIDLTTPFPGNVIPGDQQPAVDLALRDLAGEPIGVFMEAFDLDGRSVDTWARTLTGGRMQARWTPRLPGLGWYRVVVRITQAGETIATAGTDFAHVLPPSTLTTGPRRDLEDLGSRRYSGLGRTRGGSPDRERFGIIATHADPVLAKALPEIVRLTGVGAVDVPIMTHEDTLERVADRGTWLGRAIDALLADWQELTLTIPSIPASLADRVGLDPFDAPSLLGRPRETWSPYLDPTLDRYGQIVRRYRFGGLDPDSTLVKDAPLESLLAARDALSLLVPGPIAATTWRETDEITPSLVANGLDKTLHFSAHTPRDAIALLASEWRSAVTRDPGDAGGGLSVAIEPLDARTHGFRGATDELIKRAVLAWEALGPSDERDTHARSIALTDPWERRGRLRPKLVPKPELAAWRNVIERLAMREVVDELDLVEGVRCLLLAPRADASAGRGGALVLWAESPNVAEPVVELFLGAGQTRVVDVFGNETPIAVDSSLEGPPMHTLRVGRTPMFVEGIDVDLVRLAASLRIEPAELLSKSEEQERTIVFTNPWSRGIEGRLLIVEPGGYTGGPESIDRSWRITPRVVRFAAGPGETSRTPVAVAFSPFEEAGPKRFVVDVEFAGQGTPGRLRITRTVELGHPDLMLLVSARRSPGPEGPDVIIDVEVVNRGEIPLTLELTSRSAGFPLERSTISDLDPGRAMTRTFIYPNGAETLSGTNVRVSLAAPALNVRLNRSAEVP